MINQRFPLYYEIPRFLNRLVKTCRLDPQVERNNIALGL
jgi:hypothetical protein